MNKKLFRLPIVAVALLSACANNAGEDPSVNIPHVDEMGYPICTNKTLHKVNVVDNPSRAMVKEENGVRTGLYKIVYNQSDNLCVRAAKFIEKYLNLAADCEFKSMTSDEYANLHETLNTTSKVIFVGCEDYFEFCDMKMPEDDLDISGYYIKTKGNLCFIMGNTSDGYQPAAIQFLRRVVGFDFVSVDFYSFEKTGNITLPDIEMIEAPDYQLQTANNKMNSDDNYGFGYTTHYPFAVIRSTIISKQGDDYGKELPEEEAYDGDTWHNIAQYVSFGAESRAKHPKWYAENAYLPDTICYCAHDDPVEFDALVDQVMKTLKRTHLYRPEASIINVTQMDNLGACGCEFCTKHKAEDGAISGTQIRFMNALDNKFQAWLEEEAARKGTKKDVVHLEFFAYQNTKQPPMKSPEEDPTLKCNPSLYCCVALTDGKYVKPFYDEVNETPATVFKNWSTYASNITAWTYETSYNYEFFPYNTYSAHMLTYRYMKEKNASIMISEGQRSNLHVSCFGQLKNYLDSKSGFDVNETYNMYVDKFFNTWFKDASPFMRQYYEEMIARETYLEDNESTYGIGSTCYNKIGAKAEYWPQQMLINWLDLCDKARNAIAKYQSTDKYLYESLMTNILSETIFPRYALITLYPDSYSADVLREMRLEFKKDAATLNLLKYAHESYQTLANLYISWGI